MTDPKKKAGGQSGLEVETCSEARSSTVKKRITYTEDQPRGVSLVGLSVANHICAASSDEAWAAIDAFESPERARLVMAGELPAYFEEIVGAANALHISPAAFFEGVTD
ncbi:hypothetical protein [Leifsonia sp. 1010]|uniref:hypothetical protein n=1 Tax=Leifsonia sp. 1010 TaxID=2817769 RepID=UPI00285D3642|nr:hypothetical protein [Leifsonia sp. 1010]MDR6613590.1 hypothetical protein [Leifsonia sp. 1010]